MKEKPPEAVTRHFPQPMRFVLGLGLLTGFAALGEALSAGLHLPLPGAVLGMVLLWSALSLNIVRLHWLEQAADGLLGILGLLFIPATVGFVNYLSAGSSWVLWLLVMLAGLLVGAGAAGLIASRLVND